MNSEEQKQEEESNAQVLNNDLIENQEKIKSLELQLNNANKQITSLCNQFATVQSTVVEAAKKKFDEQLNIEITNLKNLDDNKIFLIKTNFAKELINLYISFKDILILVSDENNNLNNRIITFNKTIEKTMKKFNIEKLEVNINDQYDSLKHKILEEDIPQGEDLQNYVVKKIIQDGFTLEGNVIFETLVSINLK